MSRWLIRTSENTTTHSDPTNGHDYSNSQQDNRGLVGTDKDSTDHTKSKEEDGGEKKPIEEVKKI